MVKKLVDPPAVDEEEFDKYFAILSKQELTEREEVDYIKGLIRGRKSAIFKLLVVIYLQYMWRVGHLFLRR